MLDVGLSPRVFEETGAPGGLWSPGTGLCRPSMRTNLSKHTNCFSSLPWLLNTPTFPSAAQVSVYLSTFANTFLRPEMLSLNSKVTKLSRSGNKWNVHWHTNGKEETAEFEFVIIACGFFSEPYIPAISGLDTFPGTIIHSSAYSSPDVFKDKHVAIIGGSLSSVEVAEDIAPYTASIHHLIPRPFWVVPKFLPLDPDNPGTTFLPLDLVLYRRRHSQTTNDESSSQSRWRRANENLRSLCRELSDASEDMKIDMDMPPYAVVSDMYANFVRSGRIILYTGHLTSISGSTLALSPETSKLIPENITHIIFATGFRPSSSSDILPTELLSSLSFSKEDHFLPLLLHRASLHPSLPNAAFVGHYRGPYWGIIELQARWCAGLFSGSVPWPSSSEFREGIEAEERIRNNRPRTQWPRGDYVSFGSDLAKTIGIALPPQSSELSKRYVISTDIFVPSHFPPAASAEGPHHLEEYSLQRSLDETLSKSANVGLFVAAAVYRSIHGHWKLRRTYVSRLPEYPSGPSTGTGDFIPRKASKIPGASGTAISETEMPKIEYLYSEKTTLTTSSGLQLQGTQQYIYRYDEPHDKLVVYFAKRDDEATLDYLFHEVDLEAPPPVAVAQAGPWKAKSSHFCSPDSYEVEYTFYFKGADLDKWQIKYDVKGPRKDYTMETWYTRS